jgi:hypothetical protein
LIPIPETVWPWLALVALGAYHGLNPGMGWLFAVARGMQERSRRAVVASLLPIAAGHELSIAIVVIAVALSQRFIPPHTVRLLAALVLVSFGVYKLARPRTHFRGAGMRVGAWGLAGWSFLMSSAHGAGLMLAPVLLGLPVGEQYADLRLLSLQAGLAATLHVLAMLGVMGAVAVIVYEKAGVAFLRRGWLNLDLAWAGVLVAGGAFTLLSA